MIGCEEGLGPGFWVQGLLIQGLSESLCFGVECGLCGVAVQPRRSNKDRAGCVGKDCSNLKI